MAGPLNYFPKDWLAEADRWGMQNAVTSAMQSIGEAGADIMKPLGHQLGMGLAAITPPTPAPQPAPDPLADVQPFSLGSLEDWGFGAAAPKEQAPVDLSPEQQQQQPVTPDAGAFSLPDPGSWFGGLEHAAGAAGRAAPQLSASPTSALTSAATGRAVAGAQAAGRAAGSAPSYAAGSWDQKAYAAAVRAGHPDPVEFVEQMRQESGFDPDVIGGKRSSPAGAQGIAQIMPATARAWGVDPLDPDAALAAAAKAMTGYYATYGGDSEKALAAYNMGPGNLQKYGPRGLAETNTYIDRIHAAKAAPAPSGPPPGTYTRETGGGLAVNQLTQGRAEGLSPEEALALCGPTAAIAFARANGRNPTLREAKELASSLGLWDVERGMAGPASEVKLMEAMGINAALQEGADEAAMAREIQAGRPVVVDTPQHYYVATGFDPQTRQFEFGESAKVLRRSGGRSRYRLDELASLGMGAPRASIFLRGAT